MDQERTSPSDDESVTAQAWCFFVGHQWREVEDDEADPAFSDAPDVMRGAS
jgi:hypothetical protein